MSGYTSKILRVDLTGEEITSQDVNQETARKFIGGAGLAAKILWDETDAGTDPLSSQNRLMFMIGPLTGTPVPASSRYIVAGLSPLTNIWGMATSGGFWAHEFKRTGFDGIVFSGKAKRPVYLWVHQGKAELKDAGHLWGKDCYEVSDLLKRETDPNAIVAAIGPAGERLVRFASVINDGSAGRAAARCGLGAVMGSKNLKAVVVQGTENPMISDREGLKASIAKNFPNRKFTFEEWKRHYLEIRTDAWNKGNISFKNCLEGEFKGFFEKVMEEMTSGEPYYCWGCRYGCSESALVQGRRRQVMEFMGPMGGGCLIDDLETLQEGYDLCNKYGMDTESIGVVMAFATECFEKGVITRSDTEGIELTWGNAKAMLQMVKAIGERQGFGRLLGEGVRRASENIGGLAREYALHVKGLEFSMVDPRANNVVALEYATENRGAHNISAKASGVMGHWASPELGITKDQSSLENRFKSKGIGELTARYQDWFVLLNSLTVCNHLMGGGRQGYVAEDYSPEKSVPPFAFLEWLNQVTGWDLSLTEFLKAGERIFNLQRMIGVRRGISRKDDMLPPRILTHRRGGRSEAAENLPPLGEMLNEYYLYRGWSEEGIPTRDRLLKLGLVEVTDSTH